MTTVPQPWWRTHPAYPSLVQLFKDYRINNGPHLAFVILTGLREEGYEVLEDRSRVRP